MTIRPMFHALVLASLSLAMAQSTPTFNSSTAALVSKHVSAGTIIGAAVGGTIAVCLIVIASFLCCCYSGARTPTVGMTDKERADLENQVQDLRGQVERLESAPYKRDVVSRKEESEYEGRVTPMDDDVTSTTTKSDRPPRYDD
ncbi:hypothetical protein B0H10DRAFT_1951980 [Mycena sp. CBHHK59/15]|nr:hypothetical protein B0H10DRAFT_1951980 [Mycena sp. CBHHK59/15]